MKRHSLAAVTLALAVALSGCGGASDSESAADASPSPAAPTTTAAVPAETTPEGEGAPEATPAVVASSPEAEPAAPTAEAAPPPAPSPEELLNAPVPEACEHPAGTLVDGELPGIDPQDGFVMLATAEQGAPITPLKWALPDGTPATYAILWCSRGGVSWPEIIVAYTAGPTLAGYLDLGQQSFPGVEGSEHAEVQSWAETDTGLALSLTTYEGAGFDIYTYQGFLDFENGGLVLNDITVVSGPENPR